MKTVLVDGHSVELGDAAAIAVAGLQTKLADAQTREAKMTTDLAARDTQIAELTTKLATQDAQVATLSQQIKDAAITPEKLRAAGKSYADAIATARVMAPGITIGDSMDEPAIKRAVVMAKLGDVAKDWNAEQIVVSFDTLKANMGDALANGIKNITSDGLGTVITDMNTLIADAAKARAVRFDRFENAHTTTGKAN